MIITDKDAGVFDLYLAVGNKFQNPIVFYNFIVIDEFRGGERVIELLNLLEATPSLGLQSEFTVVDDVQDEDLDNQTIFLQPGKRYRYRVEDSVGSIIDVGYIIRRI